MKISCQSCQAKYTIADDKVLGKIVKIRCKKCGETIVVNAGGGTGDAVAASAFPDVPSLQGGAGNASEPWTVNVAEGDQRSMTDAEIVDAYRAGILADDTYCWRDGMADWLPLRDIDALYEACHATTAMAPPSELARPPGVAPAQTAPMASAGNGSANGQAPAQAPTAVAAAAARRGGGRAPGGDLFGAAAQAGSEEDVMTSAPRGMPQPRAAEPEKMVGERNENSVLFSLSALTSKGPGGPPAPPLPGVEASGLIDIKQLSAQLHGVTEKKKSAIDDIMNLAGGGAFSPSLTAPTLLTAPVASDYAAEAASGTAEATPTKNRSLIFLALGGGAFVIVAAIGAMVMLMRPKETDADSKAAASATATTASATASAAPVASASATATATPVAVATAAPTETAAATDTAAKGTATAKVADAPKTAATSASPAATGAAPKTVATTAPAATAAPAAQGGSEQPFNMGEAKAKLGGAASAAQGCKKGDGPTGSGRVVVVFAPSGAVQSASVSGPPFEGTPTGACVAARFRGVRVPAFGGSPFSVSKSFQIN